MTRNTIIACSLATGLVAAAIIYWARRKQRLSPPMQPVANEHSRHLTNAFAKAKQGAY